MMSICKGCKYCEIWYHDEHSNLGMFTYECMFGGCNGDKYKPKKEVFMVIEVNEREVKNK